MICDFKLKIGRKKSTRCVYIIRKNSKDGIYDEIIQVYKLNEEFKL